MLVCWSQVSLDTNTILCVEHHVNAFMTTHGTQSFSYILCQVKRYINVLGILYLALQSYEIPGEDLKRKFYGG